MSRSLAPGWAFVGALALALVPILAVPVRVGSRVRRPRAATDEPPAGLSRDDWSQIRCAVEQASYHASHVQRPGQAPALVAPNRRQRYRTEFHLDGIQIASQPVAGKDWKLGVRLTGYGYEGDVRPLPAAAEPVADKQRVEYQHGPVTEWYENRPAGLEQGFTIAEPAERRAAPLVLALGVEGLGANVEGQSAVFTDPSDRPVVSYAGLKAWDADGRPLPSRMEATGEGLRLVVDAPVARFPLTVDPTFVQEAKLLGNTDPDGAASDNFGISVAVSGDTAVVGSYLDDVGANVDQGSAYVYVRNGGIWSQQQKLVASDGAAGDNFGGAVAISGDTVVVGAALDNTVGSGVGGQGSAYVYVRSGGLWSEQQKLTASDSAPLDNFGASVSISGDTAVVGAYLDDDVGGTVDQGSAYVYVRSGSVWSEQQKLTASDGAANDRFGVSVSVSADTAVVGAYQDTVGANFDQGSAYVYARSGSVWSQQQKLTASDGVAGDEFGRSVAVSGDTAVVGAYFAIFAPASAYVYVRSGSVWSEQQKLTASDGAIGDGFGVSVAVSGDTAVVGAYHDTVGANSTQGSAYVYVRSGGVWSQQQKLTASDGAANDQFGVFVAVSGDTAVVGSYLDDDATQANVDLGSAYVYVRSGGVWSEQQKLTASDGATSDLFGFSVAVSGDTAVVGAVVDDVGGNVDQGSAYVFVRSGGVWSVQQKLTASDGAANDEFGISVALSGDTAVVGAFKDYVVVPQQGSAYVFVRSGGVWSEQQKLTASDFTGVDEFGISVAVSGDTAVVGSHLTDVGTNFDQGTAYVYVRSVGVWSEQQKLTASDGAANDQFGISVAVSGDTAVVGALLGDVGSNGDQGSAYVYVRSGSVWNQQQKLTASDGAVGDEFGVSVAVSGDTAVVGAYFDDVGANVDQGSAYVFVRSGSIWNQQQKLTASDGAASDLFGGSVAVSGDMAVVGAYVGDMGANGDQGSAYVYVRSGGVWSEQQKLTASDGAANDQFGISVAVSGDTAVVGAYLDDVGANVNQGSAYVFREVLSPQADVGVTKTDGQTAAVPGQPVTYAIVVTNAGPNAANGAAVTDSLPSGLTGATWTCSASTGSSCTASGNGGIADTVTLLVGGSASYTLSATLDPAATGTLVNTATVAAPSGTTDPNASNDSATDTDAILMAGLVVDGELTHGYVARQDLAAPPPAADVDLFLIFQGPHRSYEVLVDGISGDIGSGSGPLLERVASDGSTVLQPSLPAGAGGSRSLRWINALNTPVADQLVRVRSAGCTTSCDASDVYRLSAWDTTGFIPRFNNSGTQITLLVLQNLGDEGIDVDIRFWSGSGVLLGGPGLQTLAAHQAYVLNTSTLLPGTSGGITVASTARYGRLFGKAVAVEPATGFTFDTGMVPRPR